MGNYYQGEDNFVDALEEVSSLSSGCSDDCCGSNGNCVSNTFKYEYWTKNMETVHERRERFLKWMGLSLIRHPSGSEELGDCDELKPYRDRNGKDEPFHSGLIDRFMSCRSFLSCQTSEDLESAQADAMVENPMHRIRNLDDGSEFLVDELGPDGMLSKLRVVGTNRMVTAEEFQKAVGSSTFVQQFLQKKNETCKLADIKKKVKSSWLEKLGTVARKVDRKGEVKSKHGNRVGSVRVRLHKKHLKELSAVHAEQDFPAHEGSILTMKFSHDGQYLATGGEDSVVRVWKVVEDERQNTFEILDNDPSCLYFSLNHVSKLTPLNVDKEMISRVKKLSKSKSSCVVLPPKIFRVMEKPVYEFYGHSGEVLALSWSMKGHLLSSSVDNTVRIWQIGHHQCLGVFSHNNYVTCVEFNPIDDNHFISGSIDGKVRIWEVERCQVVDWIDIKEIVTAVCYCPNGKQGIVGTMDGNCHFYDIIDHRLHMGAQICLQGKKKFTGKRVTGFQFCPSDSSKVMVTSADSQVRVLSGVNVMCKFKGTRNSGSHMSASFTADGKHIISVSEDSNVFMWNYNSKDQGPSPKNIVSSESFLSHNAAVAIPWSIPRTLPSPTFSGDDHPESVSRNKHINEDLQHKIPGTSPDCFSMGRGFSLESLYRSPPTWPEEKLPSSSPKAVSSSLRKFEYKFLKTAYQNTFNSPNLWGLVIVTAGWDGRIRSYLNHGLPILL